MPRCVGAKTSIFMSQYSAPEEAITQFFVFTGAKNPLNFLATLPSLGSFDMSMLDHPILIIP
jgi:hypothetical protein